MRRLLLVFFVFLPIGVGLAFIFRQHNGYVLIAYGTWRLETSLFFFCGLLAAAIWIGAFVWRLLVAGVLLPSAMREALASRRRRKARQSLNFGLLRLFEGRWPEAEEELLRLAERNDNPTINYLAAARAAQHRNDLACRDRYLERAGAQPGASALATLLVQAELQLAKNQDAEALASLTRLRELEPEHPYVLVLLAELAERRQDWSQLGDLLPALRRAGGVDQKRLRAWTSAIWCDAIDRAAAEPDAVKNVWRQVPRNLRRETALQCAYARRLQAAGADADAADRIRTALKTQWAPGLALIFGDLNLADRTEQLATVEAWLQQHGEQPELLLVAGRLCLRNRLWGRARSYLESSLTGTARPAALLELGRLSEGIDQEEQARQAYRQGLEDLVGLPD